MSETTSVLSISGRKIKDCREVAETLRRMGIFSSVTPNWTTRGDDQLDRFLIENGCQITLGGTDPKIIPDQVWKPLKTKYKLECAHLHVHGQYRGCINDYLKK